MDIVNPEVEAYMASLQARHDEPVLLEMEQRGPRARTSRSSVATSA